MPLIKIAFVGPPFDIFARSNVGSWISGHPGVLYGSVTLLGFDRMGDPAARLLRVTEAARDARAACLILGDFGETMVNGRRFLKLGLLFVKSKSSSEGENFVCCWRTIAAGTR